MVVFSTIFAPISTPDLGKVPMMIGGIPFSTLSFIGASQSVTPLSVFTHTFPVALSD